MRDRQQGPSTKLNSLEIAIIGRACRLPGASSASELWKVLSAGRCTVSRIPPGRWPAERHFHPRPKERGRSYTWAAGVLDDIWGFDPAVFGISPREAEQMDPQQRLLLELTWEALEDAGIRPSSLAGTETGVFVGGSTLDYGNLRLHDPAGADAYFATGNTLAILSNRISYVFDLHGPSFTIDTACSSSFVALDAAVAAIESGRIETAIVGGVNILASPFGFISFSQATMLSPTGLCRAFSAKADGYVRAEGGIVLILRGSRAARAASNRAHAVIAGSQTNSDGRTSGISLPSKAYQAALLERAYLNSGVDPRALAFIEAHGTGTRAGDPVEAAAIGEVLGQRRSAPLPVGSVKTNIGHTEAASGLAGLFKAMLALEHDELPRSLHFDEPNPDIPFADLNVSVCSAPIPLPRSGRRRFAGISSLGFGGTNAHVILADPPPAAECKTQAKPPQFLLLSAHCRESLARLASGYSSILASCASPKEARAVIAAAGHRRELLPERLVVSLHDCMPPAAALAERLKEASDGGEGENFATGTAIAQASPVAFVFSGNGSQWPGMGRDAYEANPTFREQFAKIDRIFRPLAGWSLIETLRGPGLEAKLDKTSIAQPLIFAIQVASVRCLARLGVLPHIVLGHSVGEIAAAEAAGILDLESAIRVIYFRSRHQEIARERGGMAVVFGPQEAVETLAGLVPGLAIAAHNSPRSFTVAGSSAALDQAAKKGRAYKLRIRRMQLAYPFHSELMKPAEVPLIADLECLQPKKSRLCFLSTVDAGVVDGSALGARYWWRNIREPVRFMEAAQLAIKLGARVLIEIGPSPVLLADIRKIAEEAASAAAVLGVLDQKPAASDPFPRAAARAMAHGARIDAKAAFGDDTGPVPNLPSYPWRRKPYRLEETPESTGWMRVLPSHPLIGVRPSPDSLEWRGQLDPVLLPPLADHKIEGQVLLAGAAIAEMALAVARDWLATETVALRELEIVQPMVFLANGSRETLCRVAPATATIEIMSRARLSDSPWIVHAKGKAVLKPAPLAAPDPVPSPAGDAIAGPELYLAAHRCGLEFGPAYQQVSAASRTSKTSIIVELTAAAPSPCYGLDPARLDSCFHGLILLFPGEPAAGQRAAYLPVRFAEMRLEKPGAAVARARIDLTRHDVRAIVADFTLVDREGALIARIKGARYQAMRRESPDIASRSAIQSAILASEPAAVPRDPLFTLDALAAAAGPEIAAAGEGLPPEVTLIEGWATAAAYRLARALAADGKIDPGELIGKGRLHQDRRVWLRNLLLGLEKSSLANAEGAEFVLASDPGLPEPGRILQNIACGHPHRSAELLLAARCNAIMESLAQGEEAGQIAQSAVESFESGSVPAAAAAVFLAAMLHRLCERWPRDRAVRILQIGHGPLSRLALALAQTKQARLTIYDPDSRRLERARLSFAGEICLAFADDLDQFPRASFDLVIAANALRRLVPADGQISKLAETMAPGGLLAAVEPSPSLFRDLVLGLAEGPVKENSSGNGASHGQDWAARLLAAPLHGIKIETVRTEAGPARLLMAERLSFALGRTLPARVVIASQEEPQPCEVASGLVNWLEEAGVDCSIARERSFDRLTLAGSDSIIFLAPVPPRGGTTAAAIAQRCLALKNLAGELGKSKHRLWLECPGAVRTEPRAIDAAQTSLWNFGRTLANEYPALDVRRIDTDPAMPAAVRARRIAETILSGTDETELILDADSTRVVRIHPRKAAAAAVGQSAPASRLEKGEGTGLDRIRWRPVKRQLPGPGQVEIAVAATGLNFRDVMWSLSVLPDEMLEGGLAGPALGLECAGNITAVGEGVTGLSPGDAVIAVAGGAFATHITVASNMAAKIPPGLPLEAAVTIPVAFLTAYYALITCAQLKRGEWVLIHGGAGGVGLAALQIASWRGARVISTASSAEKRDLAAMLGAEHVFDARANAFAEGVRQVTGEKGVAVVLNSLSGEAMELSLALLKPFGRFVELGKRDFLANTHIGLRPFRNNLTYFGVDLDQLMLAQPGLSQQLLAGVLHLAAEGEFSPLPYQAFKGREIIDAMRLMQQSGHVGKIVVTPPDPGEISALPRPAFRPAAGKAHLISGGCGGFGLATARWLAERGATHLVLIGRSGASSAEAQEALAGFRASGITVHAEALDIADTEQTNELFDRISRTMPPLSGIIHAAAVLDDAAIANLDAEKLRTVLAPKVTGAENLDRLTRNLPLDYFVLFSSATSAIGNPGQGNYVAANGFLEGLARERRAAGLPALAIAWGGIEDAGMLARNRIVKDMLSARAGVKSMAAREALNLMADALAAQSLDPSEAVIIISDMNWSTAQAQLPLLQSPTFSGLVHVAESAAAENRARLDIRALAATGSADEARKQIAALIVEEIARILRLPLDSVNRGKPLADIGVDSLMAVELAAALEDRLMLDAPLSTSAGAFNVNELADHIFGLCAVPANEDESIAQGLAERHLGRGIDPAALGALTALVEERSHDLTQILR